MSVTEFLSRGAHVAGRGCYGGLPIKKGCTLRKDARRGEISAEKGVRNEKCPLRSFCHEERMWRGVAVMEGYLSRRDAPCERMPAAERYPPRKGSVMRNVRYGAFITRSACGGAWLLRRVAYYEGMHPAKGCPPRRDICRERGP